MTDFKAEKGVRAQGNSVFEANVAVWGSLVVNSDVTVSGNLNVTGDITSTPNTSALGNVIPATDGNDLGTLTKKWDAFLANVYISNTGKIVTGQSGTPIGNTTAGFLVYSTDVHTTGNVEVGDSVNVSGNLVVSGNASFNSFTVSSLTTNTVSIVGNTGSINTTGNQTIDSFAKTESKHWKYIIGMDNGAATSAFFQEMICMHNDTNVYISRYGEMAVSANAVLTVEISGNNVILYANCASASVSNVHSFRVMRLQFNE